MNDAIIGSLIQRQKQGDAIILWTCRSGKRLSEAVQRCRRNGLTFNAVNENMPETIKRLGHNPRKIYADIYIDDKAVKP